MGTVAPLCAAGIGTVSSMGTVPPIGTVPSIGIVRPAFPPFAAGTADGLGAAAALPFSAEAYCSGAA